MTSRLNYESVGDNREVTIPTAGTTVVFYIQSDSTQADDTTTAKYFDELTTAGHKIAIRVNQTVNILGMNGTTFTDPITIAKDSSYTETDSGIGYTQLTIRTTVANTLIRMRVL